MNLRATEKKMDTSPKDTRRQERLNSERRQGEVFVEKNIRGIKCVQCSTGDIKLLFVLRLVLRFL